MQPVASIKLPRSIISAGWVLFTWTAIASPAHSVEPGSAPASFAAPGPTPAPALLMESYTLGAGDLVQVDIFDAPEHSGQNGRYQVLIDGTLNLPLIGKVSVKGLTLEQAGALLTQQYLRYFQRPLTTVTLLAARPLNITLTGEVNRPGSYPIASTQASSSQAATAPPTLTSALQLAGGITQAADVKNIQIQRPLGNGGSQTLTVNLWQFLQTGDRSQDLILRDGDSIVIPTATTIDLAESAQLADATFAADRSQPIPIAVVGEVFRPGSYVVTGNTKTGSAGVPGVAAQTTNSEIIDAFPTVTRAIQIAGGIKPMADIRRIQVRRFTRNGTEQVIEVNLLKLIQTGDLRQDAILQAGDTITIPTASQLTPAESAEIATASFSPDTIQVNIVGEVPEPGPVQVPPNSPLNQALLAAGGFDQRRANTDSVDLIRLNPNGTVSKQRIAVDFAAGINDRTNPALRNNDIIVVRRSGITQLGDSLGSIMAPINSVFPIFNIFRLFGL